MAPSCAGPEVTAFAHKHKLTQVSIAELIAYRQRRDKLVERVGAFSLASEIGTLHGYAYVTPFDRVHHMAFVYGEIGDGNGVLAQAASRGRYWRRFRRRRAIRASLARFQGSWARSYRLSARWHGRRAGGRDSTWATPEPMRPARGNGAKSGSGAQILKDLGISSIRLLTSSKRTYVGLGGFGIEIVATEPIEG